MLDHLPLLYSLLILAFFLSWYLRRKITSQRKCPVCGDVDPRRIRRAGLVKKFTWLRAYRCTSCAHEFFRIL